MANKNKSKDLIEFLIIVTSIVLVIFLGSYYFTRIDLTTEKRHTLMPETITLLKELPDQVFFKVYLKGEYPADIKRLEKAVKEKLDEMRAYANNNLAYEFINPSADEDPKKKRTSLHSTN